MGRLGLVPTLEAGRLVNPGPVMKGEGSCRKRPKATSVPVSLSSNSAPESRAHTHHCVPSLTKCSLADTSLHRSCPVPDPASSGVSCDLERTLVWGTSGIIGSVAAVTLGDLSLTSLPLSVKWGLCPQLS